MERIISMDHGKQATSRTLIDVLEARADQDPSLRLFTFLAEGEREEDTLTSAELAQRARAVGAWLDASGLSGQRVLLLFEQGLAFISAFFGCSFDVSFFELFAPLVCGGCILLVRDALSLHTLGDTPAPSLLVTVPSAVRALLERGGYRARFEASTSLARRWTEPPSTPSTARRPSMWSATFMARPRTPRTGRGEAGGVRGGRRCPRSGSCAPTLLPASLATWCRRRSWCLMLCR
ncbi:hypothetical protein [Chondromyces apiculatus]|uniref:Beta-ketoacyl synthase n=1 Tax=Chondromyces apiculatus DSM 436 TaxID=1192034 RepID=A0A017T788_9BACT|nr:hypothetical protein [Chondromyces apiculatus]EYF05074.1 beta-ketoacyl synthase [Chondromyces apiculatus DSM 436]